MRIALCRDPHSLTKVRPRLVVCNGETWTTSSTARLDTATTCEIIFLKCEYYTGKNVTFPSVVVCWMKNVLDSIYEDNLFWVVNVNIKHICIKRDIF